MTQPTEATIAPSVVEPSAPAALTLTRRAPGATPRKPEAWSSPAMIPATCVPCPKVSRWARSRSRLWLEKSGPCTTLPAAASAGTGTMPVSITATSTPAAGGARLRRRRSPRARRRATCRASRRRLLRLGRCSAQPLMRSSPTTATTPAVAPRARSEPAGTCATKPLTTGSDCPTVPPLCSTARCAAASSLGSARTITACSGDRARPRARCSSSATAASAASSATASSRRRRRSSSRSQRIPHTTFMRPPAVPPGAVRSAPASAYRSAARARLDTARRSYECAETVGYQRPAERAAASLAC